MLAKWGEVGYNRGRLEVKVELAGLVARLETDYPGLRFREGRRFAFRPPRTVIYEAFGREKVGKDRPEQSCVTDAKNGVKDEYNSEKKQLELWQGGAAEGQLAMQLLHEVGHALLKHRDWAIDAERVKMESMAWAKAAELCEKYGVEYEAEFAEEELDSYRNWLYQRSKCRRCGLTRYQTPDGKYHCPQCELYGAG